MRNRPSQAIGGALVLLVSPALAAACLVLAPVLDVTVLYLLGVGFVGLAWATMWGMVTISSDRHHPG